MQYVFELVYNISEVNKNICLVKNEGAFDNRTATR